MKEKKKPCTKCKKKQEKEKIYAEMTQTENQVKLILIIVTLFSAYGFYSLIKFLF